MRSKDRISKVDAVQRSSLNRRAAAHDADSVLQVERPADAARRNKFAGLRLGNHYAMRFLDWTPVGPSHTVHIPTLKMMDVEFQIASCLIRKPAFQRLTHRLLG
jgi:hypothetical protein